MNAITAPLRELAEFEEGQALLKKTGACVGFTGCVDSQKLHMAYGLSDGFRYKIIVTFSDLKAREIFEDYQFYDREVTWYPAKDLIFYQADIHGNQLVTERMKALRKIIEGKPQTVITTFAALMSPQVPLEEIAASVIHIDADSSLNEGELARKLAEMGYEKNYQVDAPGQFSIRGGIIDIFDLTEENPYRIELWGEEVESIRSFDLLSQRSVEKLNEVDIYPATEMMLSEEQKEKGLRRIEKEAKEFEEKLRSSFLTEEAHRVKTQIKELREQVMEFSQMTNLESYIRYFYEDTVSFLRFFPEGESCVFIDEAARVKEQALAVEMEFRESMGHRLEKGYILPGQADLLYGWEETAGFLQHMRTVLFSSMDSSNALLKPQRKFDVNVKSMSSYNSSFDALVADLKRYKKNGYRVLLLSGSRTRARRLAEDLQEQGLADTDGAGTQNKNLLARIRFHGFIFPAVYGIIVRGARFKFCGAGIHHFIRGNDTVVITLLLNLFRRDTGKTADNRIRELDPFRFSEKFRSERAFGKSLFHFHDNGYLINKPMIHHGDFMDRVIIDSLTDGFGNHIDSLVIHDLQTL